MILISVEEEREWICTSKKIVRVGEEGGGGAAGKKKTLKTSLNFEIMLMLETRKYDQLCCCAHILKLKFALFRFGFGSESGNIEQYLDGFELKPIK